MVWDMLYLSLEFSLLLQNASLAVTEHFSNIIAGVALNFDLSP